MKGIEEKKDHLDIAKDVLVYMVVGENFKLPVAYFLLNGLEALERAALTQEVIRHVNETGAKVISLTGDGLIANIACLKHLGVIRGKPISTAQPIKMIKFTRF